MSRISEVRRLLPITFWRLSNVAKCYPNAKWWVLGLTGGTVLYSLNCSYQAHHRQTLIDTRKAQLSKEVYELRDEELVHPPWNAENLHEWLYRPVRITGRPLHYKAMYVPRYELGKAGYEYIVPFVTRENKDQSEQWGVLVSLGFIPHEYKDIANRCKLESALPQTFECYVSQLDELKEHSLTTGNYANDRWSSWNYVDLQHMAQYTGFKNSDKIGTVVLERIALDTTLDERNMRLYDLDADHHMDYPYLKSRSGALYYHNEMPWDWQRRSTYSISAAVVFGTISTILHLVR